MDGSGIEGKVGAVAMTKDKNGKRITLGYRLGNKGHHTIYRAELVGIILATHMAMKKQRLKKLTIHKDNQAAIQALKNSTNKPQSYLTKHIISTIK